MSLKTKDLIQYVARKWWDSNGTVNPDPDDLEPIIQRFFVDFELRMPAHNVIKSVANQINEHVMRELVNIQHEELMIQQREEHERMKEVQIIYNRAKDETERRARTNVNKVTRNKFKTKTMEGLSDEIIDELYDLYSSLWDELHGDMEARPLVPRDKPFKDKVNEFVITHPDDLLTYDEFINVSKGWNRKMTQEEAYRYYRERFFALPGVTVKIDEPDDLEKVGFKSKEKYIFGTRDFEMNPKIEAEIKNSFPLKENLKRFKLHKVAPRGTYIIDFMIVGKLIYLVAINVNTRYGMIELTNITDEEGDPLKKGARLTTSFLRALTILMNEVSKTNPIKYLTGDGEGAFDSRLAHEFYNERGIEFHPVPRMHLAGSKKTDPLHSSLAMIDRFIRTLRDMIFNARLTLTPLALKEMVRQYNNAPHSTLSKWLGFPVSPLMVQRDLNKEEYIVMKINKANVLTKLSRGFDIPVGSKVKIFNEKDSMAKRRRICRPGIVVGKEGSLFRVRTENGEELIPRFKLQLQI